VKRYISPQGKCVGISGGAKHCKLPEDRLKKLLNRPSSLAPVSYGAALPHTVSKWSANLFPRFYLVVWDEVALFWMLALTRWAPELQACINNLQKKLHCHALITSEIVNKQAD
jgi:hypothetical protein